MDNNQTFVIVRHISQGGFFLFNVAKCQKLYAGDYVLCDTKRGSSIARCVCDSFECDPEIILPMFGTDPEKMKSVTHKLIPVELKDVILPS